MRKISAVYTIYCISLLTTGCGKGLSKGILGIVLMLLTPVIIFTLFSVGASLLGAARKKAKRTKLKEQAQNDTIEFGHKNNMDVF